MSKKLIDRIRELQAKDWASPNEVEAANLIEKQQRRIELYEQALMASWPEGAMGDAFDYWNAARKEDK